MSATADLPMAENTAAEPAASVSDTALRGDWIRFTALSFLFSFGFAMYMGVFQNFLKEHWNATPFQLGSLESLRELPGLLAALTAGTLAALAESRVAGVGLLITGIGIGATGFMPDYGGLIAITVFWSVGFHLWATVSSAITLALSKNSGGGRNLGRMGAVGSLATVTALGMAAIIHRTMPHLSYNVFFVIAGISIVLAGVLCETLGTHASTDGPRARLILRREYNLFYLLTFLEGCRRQIFMIFASFTLIKVYGVNLENMLILQLVNAILIAFTAPRMGRWIDSHGERLPLTLYSIGLIIVFAGYALSHNVAALVVLFLLDNILFSFSVGFTTYLKRIVRPGELTPCLAMGVTMNHIAAVTVPVGGAWLWSHYNNYQIPFWVGVLVAVGAFLATLKLPHGRAETAKV